MPKRDLSRADLPTLFAEYVAMAEAHGRGIEAGDVPATNRAARRFIAARRELQRRPGARPGVLALLDHPDPSVRSNAAVDCLAFAPDRAEPVLAQVAEKPGSFVAFSAGWVLQQWRAGERVPDPWAPDSAA